MAAQCRGRGKAGPGALMTSFGGSGAINNNATSGSASTARSTTGTSKSLYGKASGDGASDSNDSRSKSDYDYTADVAVFNQQMKLSLTESCPDDNAYIYACTTNAWGSICSMPAPTKRTTDVLSGHAVDNDGKILNGTNEALRDAGHLRKSRSASSITPETTETESSL
ncbi:hypothetical protein Bbelb_291310 [Branchiostoma belcheri]|nr:hypothetical protein Bbelb_291310 [Branchiostoma belcheri]